MAWKDGFVIEYIPTSPRKKDKRKRIDCRDCAHVDLQHKVCKKRPIAFWEYGSYYYGYYSTCKYFSPNKSLKGDRKRKAIKIIEKRTARNQNTCNTVSIPIPISNSKSKPQTIPEKRTINIDRFIESRKKIQDATRMHLLDDNNKILEDVKNSNFIELWDKGAQPAKCDCGGELVYAKGNEVYFHIENEKVSIRVWGQYCKECHKTYIAKNNVLNRIRSIEKGK